MMKRLVPVFVAIVAGCATSNFSYGRDFPTENVAKVVKGQTTAAQLQEMFGQPFSRTVISEHEEKWIYTYTSGSAQAQGFIAMSVKSSSRQKVLDLLLKDGVVSNFAFSEGPGPTSSVH